MELPRIGSMIVEGLEGTIQQLDSFSDYLYQAAAESEYSNGLLSIEKGASEYNNLVETKTWPRVDAPTSGALPGGLSAAGAPDQEPVQETIGQVEEADVQADHSAAFADMRRKIVARRMPKTAKDRLLNVLDQKEVANYAQVRKYWQNQRVIELVHQSDARLDAFSRSDMPVAAKKDAIAIELLKNVRDRLRYSDDAEALKIKKWDEIETEDLITKATKVSLENPDFTPEQEAEFWKTNGSYFANNPQQLRSIQTFVRSNVDYRRSEQQRIDNLYDNKIKQVHDDYELSWWAEGKTNDDRIAMARDGIQRILPDPGGQYKNGDLRTDRMDRWTRSLAGFVALAARPPGEKLDSTMIEVEYGRLLNSFYSGTALPRGGGAKYTNGVRYGSLVDGEVPTADDLARYGQDHAGVVTITDQAGNATLLGGLTTDYWLGQAKTLGEAKPRQYETARSLLMKEIEPSADNPTPLPISEVNRMLGMLEKNYRDGTWEVDKIDSIVQSMVTASRLRGILDNQIPLQAPALFDKLDAAEKAVVDNANGAYANYDEIFRPGQLVGWDQLRTLLGRRVQEYYGGEGQVYESGVRNIQNKSTGEWHFTVAVYDPKKKNADGTAVQIAEFRYSPDPAKYDPKTMKYTGNTVVLERLGKDGIFRPVEKQSPATTREGEDAARKQQIPDLFKGMDALTVRIAASQKMGDVAQVNRDTAELKATEARIREYSGLPSLDDARKQFAPAVAAPAADTRTGGKSPAPVVGDKISRSQSGYWEYRAPTDPALKDRGVGWYWKDIRGKEFPPNTKEAEEVKTNWDTGFGVMR
jgi:hypothetical protein